MSASNNRLTRIGVFYDGNYFSHVSNYYLYNHDRHRRLSITGLHNFARGEVAKAEGTDVRFCQVVDAHFFRGRLSATDAEKQSRLMGDRIFDDVLMREGIVTHYLPLANDGEKGIDVALALEVLELSVYKRFDVCVLITGDRDFVPLVRKLNTLGTRVMLFGWEFQYMDANNVTRETRTSQYLIEEVTYPIMVSEVIDDRTRRNDVSVNNLFLAASTRHVPPSTADATDAAKNKEFSRGEIITLKLGYGFIKSDDAPGNAFFHYSSVTERDFNSLKVGDLVAFRLEKGAESWIAKDVSVRSQ